MTRFNARRITLDEPPQHAVVPSEYRLRPPDDDPPDVEGPPQFGIRSLLIVQAAFAVFLGLLMAVGVFAVLLAFLLTIMLQRGPGRIRNVELRRVVFDLMAGIALPVLCIWYDPIVFGDGGIPVLVDLRTPFYLLILLEIVALSSWLLYNTVTGRPSGLFAGMLTVGGMGAVAVGVVLLPFTLMGLIILIGALGLTPFLTAYVCWRNARRAMRLPDDDSRRLHGFLFALGVVLAVGIPVGLTMLFGNELNALIERIPFPTNIFPG